MTERSMEEICDEYFASINPIAHKIIEEKRKCKDKHKRDWERLTQDEKDALLDDWFIDPDLKVRYEIRLHGKIPTNKDQLPVTYPRYKVQGGTRTVHHTEHEDGSQSKGTTITWKDEFSGPFSWETKCQQDLPMISPVSITAASTRQNDVDLSENRFSQNLDSTEESQLIVSSGKVRSKDMKKMFDNHEKLDKAKVSRKDSKKDEKAREKERSRELEKDIQKEKEREWAREKENKFVVDQQPKPSQSPLAEMNLAMTEKNGKGLKREKSDKANSKSQRSPKLQRQRNSGKSSPKRESSKQRDRNVDMEGLLPNKDEAALGGISLDLGGMATSQAAASPPPQSPPTSQSEDQDSSQVQAAGSGGFDFLLSW